MDNKRIVPYISEAFESTSFGFTEETVESPNGTPIKRIMLEGEFQKAEDPNRNRRMYSEALLTRETNKLASFIAQRNGLPMGLDHPLPGETQQDKVRMQRIDMENACALCTHLEIHNKTVYGKSTILSDDMSTGTKLASFVRAGFRPGVSSRGFGSDPIPARNGLYYVPEDYNMLTYDFVTNPSVFNSVLQRYNEEQMMIFEAEYQKSRKPLYQVLTNFRTNTLK